MSYSYIIVTIISSPYFIHYDDSCGELAATSSTFAISAVKTKACISSPKVDRMERIQSSMAVQLEIGKYVSAQIQSYEMQLRIKNKKRHSLFTTGNTSSCQLFSNTLIQTPPPPMLSSIAFAFCTNSALYVANSVCNFAKASIVDGMFCCTCP